MARVFKKIFSEGPVLAVVMIALSALITHGLMISRLGYYYDDWYMLWSGASRGAGSLVSLFSMDRPFMGVIYSYLYRMLHDSIPGWHWLALLVRIAGGGAFYWIVTSVWPGLKKTAVLSAMIFVVFPGFLAQPNAATKINHLIGYGAALFSIALTLQAAKTPGRSRKFICTALSMLLLALYVWIYEYMIGLEVMRVVLLFWMQRSMIIPAGGTQRAKVFGAARNMILVYIPYAAVILAFLFWRVKIFESTRVATDLRGLVDEYQADFFSMALRLIFQVVKDFFSTTLFAWGVQAYHLLADAVYGQIITALAVSAVVTLLAVGYVYRLKSGSGEGSEESDSAGVFIAIGSLITLGAVFPVVLSNRFIDLMNPYKGYALHPSAGVMIMVMGLASMLRPKYAKAVLIGLLGFSVMVNSLSIQSWSNFWEVQRNFWWQLTWRAPDIRDNTLIMAYVPDGYALQQDYEIWGPVNLIYSQDPLSLPPIQAEVLNTGTLMDVIEGRVTDPYVRDIFMPRDFRNLLLVSQPTTGSCIHVIDGQTPFYSTSERLIVQKAGPYSKVDRIITDAAYQVPPEDIFGKEPRHGWCYLYQQAALARQTGDWARIAQLYDEAAAGGLRPQDRSEYFVFIEGLVNQGRVEDARQIADQEIRGNDALRYSFCSSLESAPDYPDAYGYRKSQINELVCQ